MFLIDFSLNFTIEDCIYIILWKHMYVAKFKWNRFN